MTPLLKSPKRGLRLSKMHQVTTQPLKNPIKNFPLKCLKKTLGRESPLPSYDPVVEESKRRLRLNRALQESLKLMEKAPLKRLLLQPSDGQDPEDPKEEVPTEENPPKDEYSGTCY